MWTVLIGLVVTVVAACGSSNVAPTIAPFAAAGSPARGGTSSAQPARALSCAANRSIDQIVGASIVAPPTAGGVGSLPTGASGIVCTRVQGSGTLVTTTVDGITPSYLASTRAALSAAIKAGTAAKLTTTSIGDAGYEYSFTEGTTTVLGVAAMKGSRYVAVLSTNFIRSVAPLEALARFLLS